MNRSKRRDPASGTNDARGAQAPRVFVAKILWVLRDAGRGCHRHAWARMRRTDESLDSIERNRPRPRQKGGVAENGARAFPSIHND